MSLRRLIPVVALLATLSVEVAAGTGSTPDKSWNFMPSRETGAQAFRQAHPGWDGRGVVVAILDTGIDALAPGLQHTTTGATKLIEVRDFSTEGDWETTLAEWDAERAVYHNADGLSLRGAPDLIVAPDPDDAGRDVYIGVIAESDFINNARVNDLNDDGDTGLL